MRKRLLALLPLALAGCSWLSPTYKRPTPSLPQTWGTATTAAPADNIDWWRSYGDPVLDQLVEDALRNSDDLALAKNHLQQARAEYDYAFASQLPMISGVGADAFGRFHMNDNLPIPHKTSNLGFVGGMLTYELDLWGKNASASDAAKAGVQAGVYAQAAARIMVESATTRLYFSIRALDAEVAILQDEVNTQTQLLALVQKQYEVRAVDALTLNTVNQQLDTAQAALPAAQDQRGKAESALAVLIGRSPQDIIGQDLPRGRDILAITVPSPTPPQLPATLIERRPDIAMREQGLIASNYAIGYARAAYFPTISLASLAGVNNVDIDNLYRATTRSWTLAAAMATPLLDFGRTRSGVKLAKTQKEEQAILYQQSIRTAFREVRDALNEEHTSATRDEADAKRVASSQENLNLTELRLKEGFASQIDVLAAQATLQQTELARVSARLAWLDASLDMYRAIGGGFSMDRERDAKKIAPSFHIH
ncbi:outer membrane protein [Acetobacter estunensis NRIC 0472]|uniref:Efflux transporter outer membrane subunit n=1 Tax=Acetobacter estunensis TaxID=104097 RepID=A0A967ECR3_9PROT|nr:TolC family protein [Acetobacter estunensis]NHO53200.1 efflux transporter outer membrane subunit [Acetobacter estunensis]GBQ24997.1 outer membrane protein [Acetobacter estunensis NRIC 0472]